MTTTHKSDSEKAFKVLGVYGEKQVAALAAKSIASSAFRAYLEAGSDINSPEARAYEVADDAAQKASRAAKRAHDKALRACEKVWTS
jgi:hypothetical protein